MKLISDQKRILFIAAVLFSTLACLCNSSAINQQIDQLEDEAQKEIQSAFDAWLEQQKDNFNSWVEDTTNQIVDSGKNFVQDQFTKAKEWLGFGVPALVGELEDDFESKTGVFIIPTIFIEKFEDQGGVRNLGRPTGKVQVIDGAIIQSFEGGRYDESIIILKDGGGRDAFVLYGKWLELYEYIGGPLEAGFPVSDADNWGVAWFNILKNYGKGKAQFFRIGSDEYAMMQPQGEDVVFLIPPEIWEPYEADDLVDEIGYPISGRPLSLTADYLKQLAGNTEFKDLFASQTHSIQIFENGSLWLDNNRRSNYEVILEKGVRGNQTNILLGMGRALKFSHENLLFSSRTSECQLDTFETAYKLSLAEGVKDLLIEVAKLPLKATITGLSLGVGSPTAKFVFSTGGYILEVAGSDQVSADTVIFIGSTGADSVFSKLIGDYLSLPISELSEEMIRQQVSEYFNDRRIWNISTSEALDTTHMKEDMIISFMYDPKTHMTSGVFTSSCAPRGYFFSYRTDTTTGYPENDSVKIFDISRQDWIFQ